MSFIERVTEKHGKEFAKDLIQTFMRKKKMDSVDELIKQCPELKDFSALTKYENYTNIIRTHGLANFNEDMYKEIIDMIKQEELKKKSLNTDNIETTNVNGHEIVKVKDEETNEEILYDNTSSNRDFKDEMKEVQNEHKQFQSKDNNNTLGVMNYMKDNIKITPELEESDEVEVKENNEEQLMMEAVKKFENEVGHTVKVDFNTKMIYDNDIVYSIEKHDDEYVVVDSNTKNKSHVKTLTKKINN